MSLFLIIRKQSAILRLTQALKRAIRLKASAILFVSLSAVGADKLDDPKFDKSKAKKRFRTCRSRRSGIYTSMGGFQIQILRLQLAGAVALTTRLPITTVARKKGIQDTSPTYIQSHIDSIHSPQSTRNTIMKECMKSVKFQRGNSPSGNRSFLSESRT